MSQVCTETPNLAPKSPLTCSSGAHRVYIVLSELGLPFEEAEIDLSRPRDPSYLEINPRGLVPSLKYNGEILTESAIIAQFLADAHPSHLVLPSNAPDGALQRARIGFFVDASISKVVANLMAFIGAKTDAEGAAHIEAYIEGVVKELEPLLKDAKPFFGGSDKLTLAEVSTFGLSKENSFALLKLIAPLGSHWLIRHSVVGPFQDWGDPEQLGDTIEGEGAGLLHVGSGCFSPSKCYWDFQ